MSRVRSPSPAPLDSPCGPPPASRRFARGGPFDGSSVLSESSNDEVIRARIEGRGHLPKDLRNLLNRYSRADVPELRALRSRQRVCLRASRQLDEPCVE